VGYALAEELHGQESAFTFARSTLYLHHLAVLDAARHRGIGRLLMATVDEEARRRGVEEIRLDYWLFNSPASRFFGALGYVPYSERVADPSRPGWPTSSRSPVRPAATRCDRPSMVASPGVGGGGRGCCGVALFGGGLWVGPRPGTASCWTARWARG